MFKKKDFYLGLIVGAAITALMVGGLFLCHTPDINGTSSQQVQVFVPKENLIQNATKAPPVASEEEVEDEVDETEEETADDSADENEDDVEATEEDESSASEETTDADEEDPSDMTEEERMAKFKAEHPEAYERYMATIQRRKEALSNMLTERQSFLDNVDTSLLTKEQAEHHRAYADAVAQRDAITLKINELTKAGEEVPAELYREKRAATRAVYEKHQEERNLLLQAAGKTLGLDEALSADFVDMINTILHTTDYNFATQRAIEHLGK